MRYFVSAGFCLKWLETPSLYNRLTDELYELDDESFSVLRQCSTKEGGSCSDDALLNYCLQEGILVKEPVNIQRPPALKSPDPSLRYLELQITDRCNLSCRHCYIGRPERSELAPEQIRDILYEFQKMQGLRLMITGGEPLLHSAFGSINNMLPEFFFRKVLFTNGHLITEKVLEDLKVDEIQISIDGLEGGHDSLRGSGSFKKAMEAVRLSRDMGFDVSVATMVHPGNINDFDAMESLFREIGIRDWTVDVPCISGRLKENPELQLSPAEAGRFLKYGFGEGLHGGGKGYGCGLHLMSVTSDGKAAKCTFYHDRPAGNISDGLWNCWQRIRPVLLRDIACDCIHLNACRGGCRYRAELLGNPQGRDLYRCSLYDIL